MLTLSQSLDVHESPYGSGSRVFVTHGTEIEFVQILWSLTNTGFHGGNGESIDIWKVPSNVTIFRCKFFNVWNDYGVGATVHCAKATLNLTETIFENCTCSPDDPKGYKSGGVLNCSPGSCYVDIEQCQFVSCNSRAPGSIIYVSDRDPQPEVASVPNYLTLSNTNISNCWVGGNELTHTESGEDKRYGYTIVGRFLTGYKV